MEREPKALTLSNQELRQLQLVQLEILQEVDRICRKHRIGYCMGYGTLLGAVRHKGFIPWDDDLDILMLRHDYERFRRICRVEFPPNLFFQDERTDLFYRWGYAKIRRTDTEYIRAGQEKMKYQTGIFIDVFPLDVVPQGGIPGALYDKLFWIFRKLLWSEAGKRCSKGFFLRQWYSILSLIPKQAIFYWTRSLVSIAEKRGDSGLIRCVLFQMFHKKQYGFPRTWAEERIDLEFEGQKFQAPKAFDEYLIFHYGDYMTPPPPEKRAGHAPVSVFRLPGHAPRSVFTTNERARNTLHL